jgi:hypothetical protein
MLFTNRHFWVSEWRQDLVNDFNCSERSSAGLWMVCGNGGDWFTHVSNDIECKHWLVFANESVRQLSGNICRSDDGLDTSHFPGF